MSDSQTIDIGFLPEPTLCEIPGPEALKNQHPPVPVISEGERIPLERARKLADRILEALKPVCWRCEVAGSIRRGRPFVGDVDIVCIPVNHDLFRKRVTANTTVVTDGAVNMIVRLQNRVQLDIFCARPEQKDMFETIPSNFGSLFLCRTGSKEFNRFLCMEAQRHGLHWDSYQGVKRAGKVIASETEEDIFRALGLAWIKPEDRER
jgi:DNA polymerase (family X)